MRLREPRKVDFSAPHWVRGSTVNKQHLTFDCDTLLKCPPLAQHTHTPLTNYSTGSLQEEKKNRVLNTASPFFQMPTKTHMHF